MAKKFWEDFPLIERTYFELAESERKHIEIRLRDALSRLQVMEDNLKKAGKSEEEIMDLQSSRNSERTIAALEARVKLLEAENSWLRKANWDLANGKTPEEVIQEAEIPEKKIKKPGRPGIEPWEAGKMRKNRKEGWTVREIAAYYGKSVGAVQKIVASVDVDPAVVDKHRKDRNKALSDQKKATKKK